MFKKIDEILVTVNYLKSLVNGWADETRRMNHEVERLRLVIDRKPKEIKLNYNWKIVIHDKQENRYTETLVRATECKTQLLKDGNGPTYCIDKDGDIVFVTSLPTTYWRP